MITKIGLVAGEIWEYLEMNNNTADMDEIIQGLGHGRDLVLMSIGWLSRESHILLEGEDANLTIKLSS